MKRHSWPQVTTRLLGRLAQLVRAPRLHRGSRRFEPVIAHICCPLPIGAIERAYFGAGTTSAGHEIHKAFPNRSLRLHASLNGSGSSAADRLSTVEA